MFRYFNSIPHTNSLGYYYNIEGYLEILISCTNVNNIIIFEIVANEK